MSTLLEVAAAATVVAVFAAIVAEVALGRQGPTRPGGGGAQGPLENVAKVTHREVTRGFGAMRGGVTNVLGSMRC